MAPEAAFTRRPSANEGPHLGTPTGELRPVAVDPPPAKQWVWYRRPGVVVTLTVVIVAALVAVPIAVLRLGQTAGPSRSVRAGPPAAQGASPTSTSTPASATPLSFSQLFAQDSSGVVRLDGTSCSGSAIGTGFLVAPTLVATAAHVVNRAAIIGVTAGGDTRVGNVVGLDGSDDVALVRLNQPLPGHVFGLQAIPPSVGSPVAAMGFPEGLPITFTQGSISGLDRTIPVEGQTRTGLIQTDASVNPGNSGGPLLGPDGKVVGLVDAGAADAQGISFAVSSKVAEPLLSSWQANPQTVTSQSGCGSPTGPSADASPHSELTGADATAIGQTLLTYFRAIDAGDYATAWNQFSAEQRAQVTQDQFARGLRTSYDFNISLHSLTPQGPSMATVYLTFSSLQSPQFGPHGESCDLWSLDYTMQYQSGSWLIERAESHNGQQATPCG
jgi:serine protease Do